MEAPALIGFIVGVCIFLGALLYGPKMVAWVLGYIFRDVRLDSPPPPTQQITATQVRTWEHPTEGTQVEVSQVDVKS